MRDAKLSNSRAHAVAALAERQQQIIAAANAQLKEVGEAISELAAHYASLCGVTGDTFSFEQHSDGVYVVGRPAPEAPEQPEQEETR